MNIWQDIRRINNPIYFDRMIAKGNLRQFIIVILLLPIVFYVVGLLMKWSMFYVIGTDEPFAFAKEGLFWDTYENYINTNGHPDYTFSRRLYMLIGGIVGVFLLNGILVSAIVSWVEKRGERWQSGELYYDKKRWFQKSFALKNFVVVIGGNEMVPELTRQLLSADKTLYALIMTNRDVSSLRKKIASVLGEDEERVVIYHGERTFAEDLAHLQIERANGAYVIGEQLDVEQNGSHHDVKNMECVRLMAQYLHQKYEMAGCQQPDAAPKLCRVMFEYQSTFSVFQFTDVDSSISSVLNFRPFNYYETWAQNVFVCPSLNPDAETVPYLPLEGRTAITSDSQDTVHLIVVGMSRMGIALGIEAAHLAHYPNFVRNSELRTKITFIDPAAKREMQIFQGHYKELFALSRWRYVEADDEDFCYNRQGNTNNPLWHNPLKDEKSNSPYRDAEGYTLGENIVDVDWEFIQGDLEMPAVQRYIRDAAIQKDIRLTIAICFPKDNASFAASLYLPDEVYDEHNNVVQVLAYQPYGDAMCHSFQKRIEMNGSTLAGHRFNQFAKLRAFGMLDSCYDISKQRKMEDAADQLWKQYDKAYSGRVGGRNAYRKILGKEVAVKAGKSLAARQWSNTYAAAHLWTKLRNIGWNPHEAISEDNLTILAQQEHIRWNMEQLLFGFAPLRPDEQKSIKEKLKKAESAEYPQDELQQLSAMGKEEAELKQFPKLEKWLDAWKDFDEEKEFLKANMSHTDICSFEVLKMIDKEAIKYDEDLTKILPDIYECTKTIYG